MFSMMLSNGGVKFHTCIPRPKRVATKDIVAETMVKNAAKMARISSMKKRPVMEARVKALRPTMTPTRTMKVMLTFHTVWARLDLSLKSYFANSSGVGVRL